MEKKFKAVDKSELEDFDTECRACGLDPKEFELSEHDYIEIPRDSFMFTFNAKLTVTRKNISKTYLTGNATHWVADFSDDLRKGVFS